MPKYSEVEKKINDLILLRPAYSSIPVEDIDGTGSDTMEALRDKNISMDIHCIYCGMITPFKSMRSGEHYNNYVRAKSSRLLRDDVFTLHMHCQRETSHTYTYVLKCADKEIIKIGQTPSLEDIDSQEIKKFRPVLDRLDFSELHRAGGLASHGIGIGAFVYLRRIFERLVRRHYDEHSHQHGPIEGWESLRIDERIKALSTVLPSALVENRKVYSILSAGIHELDEETCRKHFPIVRAGIIAILEEDLQAKEKARAAEELRKSIAEISGKVAVGKATATPPAKPA